MQLLLARLLTAWLALAPAPASEVLDVDAAGLDALAVERGLRARLGDELDGWRIEVRPTELAGTYAVTLGGPSRAPEQRRITVAGTTDEDRSRELASMLALILLERLGEDPSEADDPEAVEPNPEPIPEPSSPPEPVVVPIALLVVEGRVGLGPPRALDPSSGLGLGAGLWLVRDFVQPRLRIGWARSRADSLRVDAIDVGLGVAAGIPLRHWWFGALVMPTFRRARALEVRSNTALAGGGELSVLVEYRRPWLVVGLRTGVDASFPPLVFRGSQDIVRWGAARWMLALEVGLGLGRRER